jgi:hypothetical protein
MKKFKISYCCFQKLVIFTITFVESLTYCLPLKKSRDKMIFLTQIQLLLYTACLRKVTISYGYNPHHSGKFRLTTRHACVMSSSLQWPSIKAQGIPNINNSLIAGRQVYLRISCTCKYTHRFQY